MRYSDLGSPIVSWHSILNEYKDQRQESLTRTFFSYFWPVLCGLLIAAIVWLGAPEWLQIKPAGKPEENPLASLIEEEVSGPVSYSAAARRAAPSVVNIYTSKTVAVAVNPNPLLNDPFFRRFFNNQNLNALTQEQTALGTGVVVSRDGYVLTNEHVIYGADEILVMLYDGRTSAAKVVGVDSATDLAVLKIDLNNLTAISIGDPEAAEVGDVVLAIGNPWGFGQTVTQGILSATGRNLVGIGMNVNLNFLQTDAAINEGNSGGPLVDVYGNMIGLNSRTFQDDGSFGLSFAIPADIALNVFRDILEHGTVIRGWLGIDAQARKLNEEASQSLGLKQVLVVTGLFPGGPGHRAGFEPGDVIAKINGKEITDARRVIRMITDTSPGNKIDFEILRGDQTLTITAQVDPRPEETLN